MARECSADGASIQPLSRGPIGSGRSSRVAAASGRAAQGGAPSRRPPAAGRRRSLEKRRSFRPPPVASTRRGSRAGGRELLGLDKARPQLKTSEDLTPELRKELKQRLGDRGMAMFSFYADLAADAAKAKKIFDFTAEMGADTIVAEPPAAAFDMI